MNLPVELLQDIIGRCDNHAAIRLTCRSLSDIATAELYRHVTVSSFQFSLDKLSKIAERYGQHVKKVTFMMTRVNDSEEARSAMKGQPRVGPMYQRLLAEQKDASLPLLDIDELEIRNLDRHTKRPVAKIMAGPPSHDMVKMVMFGLFGLSTATIDLSPVLHMSNLKSLDLDFTGSTKPHRVMSFPAARRVRFKFHSYQLDDAVTLLKSCPDLQYLGLHTMDICRSTELSSLLGSGHWPLLEVSLQGVHVHVEDMISFLHNHQLEKIELKEMHFEDVTRIFVAIAHAKIRHVELMHLTEAPQGWISAAFDGGVNSEQAAYLMDCTRAVPTLFYR